MTTSRNSQLAETVDHCRRIRERRRFSSATIYQSARAGNRRTGRRTSDQWGYYVDRYEPRWLYTALGILVLCAMDAVLTLNLLPIGAREINPFMALLMNIDIGLFALVKMSITALGVGVLVVHIKFRLFKFLPIGFLLYGLLPLYACLIIYELALLAVYR